MKDFHSLIEYLINLFQSIVAIHIETSHFICSANQKTGFYIKCSSGQEWVSQIELLNQASTLMKISKKMSYLLLNVILSC